MGSPSFGMMPGNNAPPPVFGGTNPTGMMPGGFSGKESFGFPSYPMFGGTPSHGIVTPTANLGIFGNAPASSGSGGIQGLTSGFGGTPGDPNAPSELQRQLRNDYGDGMGSILSQILNGGLFNPQVANAFLNAMQPAYNRGIASVETAFGAEGSRFGSAAALGIGDFSSQFNLNEQQTLASMYMNAQQEQLSLLENILPTVHAEQADSQSSSWIDDLLGGLEIAGGAIAAPFTGGLSLGLVGAGVSTIAGGNSKGGSTGASIPNIGLPGMTNNQGGLNFGSMAPNSNNNFSVDDWMFSQLDSSAGASLGGASSSNPFGVISEGF